MDKLYFTKDYIIVGSSISVSETDTRMLKNCMIITRGEYL